MGSTGVGTILDTVRPQIGVWPAEPSCLRTIRSHPNAWQAGQEFAALRAAAPGNDCPTTETEHGMSPSDQSPLVAAGVSGSAPDTDDLPGSRPAGWVDRLVELHILAEHGCAASADEARRWIAADEDARRVWDDVERLREQLVGGSG